MVNRLQSFVFLFALGCLFSCFSIGVSQARPVPGSFADLAADVSPSVVNISSTKFPEQRTSRRQQPFPPGHPFSFEFDFGPNGAPPPLQDFFEDFFGAPFPGAPDMGRPRGRRSMPPRAQAMGSGFIIDAEKGYIITNNHVIDGADEIKVTLKGDETLSAEIVGQDAKTDLAVLKVDPKKHDLKAVTWGQSDRMRVGDWVMAVGNPFGLGGTVTAGIISARQRNINAGPYDDFIQTDAPINRGNSGGPMFNMEGDVIGINTAIFSPSGGSVGIGFAIPSDLAQTVINQLIEFGATKRGWLGVQIQDVTDDIADSLGLDEARGALVASVAGHGPAKEAGIKAGDVILSFDGKDINDVQRLPRVVAETAVDKKVTVGIWRNSRDMTKTVVLGQLEKAEKEGLIEQADNGGYDDESQTGKAFARLGFDAAPLDNTIRRQFDIPADVTGLVITDIDERSDAADKLNIGDILIEANQQPINALKDLDKIIQAAEKRGKSSILLLVNTMGNLRFTAIKMQESTKE